MKLRESMNSIGSELKRIQSRQASRMKVQDLMDLDVTHAKLLENPLSLNDKPLYIPEGMQ